MIHASRTEDKITFQVSICFDMLVLSTEFQLYSIIVKVKKFLKTHSCTRTNKCGNKRATQGWIANVIADKLKSDGDISTTKIRKWLMTTYNVDVPYLRAFRG